MTKTTKLHKAAQTPKSSDFSLYSSIWDILCKQTNVNKAEISPGDVDVKAKSEKGRNELKPHKIHKQADFAFV